MRQTNQLTVDPSLACVCEQGYALLEFAEQDEAQAAIQACQEGLTLLDQELKADFAFVKPPAGAVSIRGVASRRVNANRDRSRSPGR